MEDISEVLWIKTDRNDREDSSSPESRKRLEGQEFSRRHFSIGLDHWEKIERFKWGVVRGIKFSLTGISTDPIMSAAGVLGIVNSIKSTISKLPVDDDKKSHLQEELEAVPSLRGAHDRIPALGRVLCEVCDLKGIDRSEVRLWGCLPDQKDELVKYLRSNALGSGCVAKGSRRNALCDEIIESIGAGENVIVEGVAGTGKSHLLDQLRGEYGERIELVVFHPSTSYEEFVSGLRPDLNGGFRGEAGVFVDFCRRAAQDPERLPYLLFIDEINRASTSRVFGDLMLPLEDSKRAHFAEPGDALTKDRPQDCVSVRLQTPVTEKEDEFRYLVVPDNLHILGTMNSSDRSVGTIDLALRRRFTWKEAKPLTGEELRVIPAFDEKYQEEVRAWDRLLNWYDAVNAYLENVLGPDALLGHSYFLKEKAGTDAVEKLLVRQLLEIVYMFNMSEQNLEEMPTRKRPGGYWKIVLKGSGLGRRPQEAWVEEGPDEGDDVDDIS